MSIRFVFFFNDTTTTDIYTDTLFPYTTLFRSRSPLDPASNGASPGARSSGERAGRSEEHTSELQSLMRISYAVFCLKKKNKDNYINHKNEKTNRQINTREQH